MTKNRALLLFESLLPLQSFTMQLISVKICGITRSEDLLLADKLGADFFGFILYPKSPRCLSLDTLSSLSQSVDQDKCICVDVMPEVEKIEVLQGLGFTRFQIHCPENVDLARIETLSERIGQEHLWLAPQTADLLKFNTKFLSFSNTILIDSYSESSFGGTGQTGNWAAFKKLKKDFPNHEWVLAGGLSPDNLEEAYRESESNHFDFNSGLESAPGIKSSVALEKLFNRVSLINKNSSI